MSPIGLLLILIVICLVFWAARALLNAFKIEDPVATIIYVILVILVILWLMQTLGYVNSNILTRPIR